MYQKDFEEVIKELGSTRSGLSGEEAQRRLDEFGKNELLEKKKKTIFLMLLDQFKDFMILVLIGAAIIAGIIGEPADTLVIIAIIIINAIIGFVQEYRAEKAMEALKKMAANAATVLRDGNITRVAALELVPGDIVMLEAGSLVPADIRLMESAQLKAEEGDGDDQLPKARSLLERILNPFDAALTKDHEAQKEISFDENSLPS